MAEMEIPKSMFVRDEDASGKPITVVTTTPDLRSNAEFAEAIYNHNNGKPTPGFLILPDNSWQAKVQRGYQGVNEPLQRIAPQVGRAAGENNPLALMLQLAAKARVPGMQQASDTVTGVSGDVGETLGRIGAEQVNTLPKAGMTAATAPLSFAVPGALSAGTNAPTALPRLLNVASAGLKTGLAGLTGAATARIAGGQQAENTPEQGLQDFAIAAAGGSGQQLIAHWLTRFLNKGMGEKVAKQMVDEFKSSNPAIGFQDNIPDIITSSKSKLEQATQMMSKALRNSLDEDTDTLLTSIKDILPGAMPASQSVKYQATLRAGIRKVIRTQNERLDNIDNPKTFGELGVKVEEAITELGDTVRGFIYPRKGGSNISMEPAAVKTEGILTTFNEQTRKYNSGAQMLHYMKQAKTDEGLDFQMLADTIRGVYKSDPGSTTHRIGRILGQGRDLTEMPLKKVASSEPLEGTEWLMKQAGNLMQHIPLVKQMSQFTAGRKPVPTPWPTRQAPKMIQPLVNETAQVSGQEAMRALLNTVKE